jgi:hypothetical protein
MNDQEINGCDTEFCEENEEYIDQDDGEDYRDRCDNEEEEDDTDRYYIKTLQLNPQYISASDKKFIMDSLLHGDRVFIDGLSDTGTSPFNIIFFNGCCNNHAIEDYLDNDLGYSLDLIRNLVNFEEDYIEIFLNRFINMPKAIVAHNAKISALARLEEEFLKIFPQVCVTHLMKSFKRLSTEEIITFYQENYLK